MSPGCSGIAAIGLDERVRPGREPLPEASLLVNINTATQAELETLPDIGPAKAATIIAGRPYGSVEDLLRVNGIGEYTLDSLKPFVTVEGDTERRE